MRKLRAFYSFVTSMHAVDTLVPVKLPKMYYRVGSISSLSKSNMMPLNPILKVELFDVWGIDIIGPFSISFGHHYILVAMDYVS